MIPNAKERAIVRIMGAVQGVGFRPFVHRLATQLDLRGWVLNCADGVELEVEGDCQSLAQFFARLEKEKPQRAAITTMESSRASSFGYADFTIRHSQSRGTPTLSIPADLAPCHDCLSELFDPKNRRFRYPFLNCTNCGPRFTLIEALPYDRALTSMRRFTMCQACTREYTDPTDRRFHAQPNACPLCGPQLALWDERGRTLADQYEALRAAAQRIRTGEIVAIKGVGGFQLLVDARNQAAVQTLRTRKHRPDKPLAVMFPTLRSILPECVLSDLDSQLLGSQEAPIVLLKKRTSQSLAPSIAPRAATLGVMLPSSPLHQLLLNELGFAVVATSGNLSDEPICIDQNEALERLGLVADAFLVHDRPIIRAMDDSVVRVMSGRAQLLRRARGYAPLPIHLKTAPRSTLAVGAQLKNAVALSVGPQVFIGQHIGDLETVEASAAFSRSVQDLPQLYGVRPEQIACDLHPDYISTQHAARMHIPLVQIQHHWAHVASCMAENGLEPPALGVAWDGTGLGSDGTIWGGEFLQAKHDGFTRVAHLRPFRLPGGETAIKQPRRSALGLLHAIFGDQLWSQSELLNRFSTAELHVLRPMLERQIAAPLTTSAGRLFDGVASLLGLCDRPSFEGQAAMELECILTSHIEDSYPFALSEDSPALIDWQPALLALLGDLQDGLPHGVLAARFHNMLTEAILAVATRVGQPRVVLSGGCFQNQYLSERTAARLRAAGFQPFWHERVPPNDGGIALGQIAAASWAAQSH